jgi:hypothetical protein
MTEELTFKRCTNCVLPCALPSITLDKDGVCNYCRQYKWSFSNIDEVMQERKKALDEIVNKYKKLSRPYDCLIPLSGVKDSTYALYICSKIYDMKCLCVTFDNGYMASHAKKNIRNTVEAAGADHLFYTVNRGLLNDLYKLFLLKAGDFCSVCMRGIEQCRQIVSKEYGIPMTIDGGGSRIAYLDIPEVFQGGEPNFFKNVISATDLEKKASSMVVEDNIWNIPKLLRLANRISRKIFKKEVIKQQSAQPIYIIHIFDYFAPSEEEVLNTIKTELGWVGPLDEVEHMDCKLHHIASYIRQLKFPEVTDTTFHHSGLIRRGLMTREEAILIEKQNLKHKETPRELDYFLKEIGLTEEEFNDAVHDWRKVDRYRDSRRRNLVNSILERIKNA